MSLRILLAAFVVALVAPAAASAGLVSLHVRDVPLGSSRSLSSSPGSAPFDMLAVHWVGAGSVEYRTQSASGRWRPWRTADDGSRSGEWHDGDLDWTGRSRAVRFRVRGDVRRLRSYELDSRVLAKPVRTTAAAGTPAIVTRAGLARERGDRSRAAGDRLAHSARDRPPHGGDQRLHPRTVCGDRARHRGVPRARERVERHRLQLPRRPVRHRVRGSRRGCRAQRRRRACPGVQRRHGWCRADRELQLDDADGGPAEGARRPARLASRRRASRSVVHGRVHVERQLQVSRRARGRTLRAISGHRDTGPTECPGARAYALLPSLIHRVAITGLPKLYSPEVVGVLGGTLRFRARLSSPLQWTVTVTNRAGATVASGAGRGTIVDWSWRSGSAPTRAAGLGDRRRGRPSGHRNAWLRCPRRASAGAVAQPHRPGERAVGARARRGRHRRDRDGDLHARLDGGRARPDPRLEGTDRGDGAGRAAERRTELALVERGDARRRPLPARAHRHRGRAVGLEGRQQWSSTGRSRRSRPPRSRSPPTATGATTQRA